MKNTFSTFAFIFILITNLHAQPGFERVYGTNSPDIFRTVIATSDGGILGGGGTNNYLVNNIYTSDAYLVKTNSNGDTLWTHQFGDSLYQIILSLAENAQGYVATGSYVVDTSGGSYDFFAIQYDQAGNKLWEKFYGTTATDLSNDVIIDNNGRIILCGGSTGYSYGVYDVYAIKLDANGSKIEEGHFGGTDHDYANAIIQTSDGGYAMAGQTHSATFGYNIYVVKTDSDFVLQWTQNYGGLLDDFGNDIAEDDNGNLWILGSMEIFPDSVGMVLIKTDANGDNPVTYFPGTHNGDFGYDIQSLSGGGFVIGGTTNNLDKGSEMLLEKINTNGDTVWTKHFGSTKLETGYAVGVDQDNNILLAGRTEGFGTDQFDAYLVKVDSAGDIPCPPSVSFVSNADSICEDENIFFTNTTVSSQQFTWSENGNNFSNQVDAGYYFASGGNYDITLSACNVSSTQNITVYLKPATHFTYPHFETDVTFILDAGINVQHISWNFGDGSPLDTTDINPFHVYASLGSYWVVVSVTDDHGCDSTYAEQINLFTGIENVGSSYFHLFPNPAHESVTLQASGNIFPIQAVLICMEGKVIKECVLRKNEDQISVSDIAPGMYFLRLQDSSGYISIMKMEVY